MDIESVIFVYSYTYGGQMGRLIQGINGPFIGKVGAITGSHRNGKPYIKGPTKKRTTKVSAKELSNREKFSAAQAWLRPLLSYLRVGFKGYSPTSEGFIAAKSYLLREAMVLNNGRWRVLPEQMKVSVGHLPLPPDITVLQSAAGELLFSWSPANMGKANPYDQAMPLAYEVATGKAYFLTTGPFRSSGSATLTVDNRQAATYQLYLSFCAADRLSQSDSIYLGELIMVPAL